ncbi:MAG: hypothetical protein AB8D78_10640 [Akkermansiaceae bacterium]
MSYNLHIAPIAAVFFCYSPTVRAEAIEDPEKIQRFITSRPQEDIITWADESRGEPFTVRFISADEKDVVVEKTLSNTLARRTLPFREIQNLRFQFTPTESAIHQNPEQKHIPILRALWDNRKPTLRLNNPETALTGLCLVETLRVEPSTETLKESSEILLTILGKDLPSHLKTRATGETYINDFLIALEEKNIALAEEAAWKITAESEYPDAMLIATSFLGKRHFEQLKAIQEEHPRWHLDDEIKPLRQRLYQLSLDFVLYPSLFHPTREIAASEGLKAAAEVYQFTQSRELRLAALEDLAALYPNSEAAKQTAEELENLRANKPDPKPEEESSDSPEEEKDSETPTTTVPPKPKRYNLFDD